MRRKLSFIVALAFAIPLLIASIAFASPSRDGTANAEQTIAQMNTATINAVMMPAIATSSPDGSNVTIIA